MKKQLAAAAISLFIAGASAFSMLGQVSDASILAVFAGAVAAGVSLKGVLDARRLQEADIDPDVLTSPLLRKLRAARRKLAKKTS
jgi:hypothetical protein